MRLQNKIHLYTSVVFAVLLIVISASIYLVFSNLTYSSELESAHDNAKGTVVGVNRTAGLTSDKELLQTFVPPDGSLTIVKEDGTSIGGTVTSAGQNILSTNPDRFYMEERSEIIEINQRPYTFVSIPNPWIDGSVVNIQMIESLGTAEENLKVLRNVLIIVTLLALVPVVISGRILSNLITRPIASMIQTMKDIQRNGEFKRLSLRNQSKDELYEMGNTFNLMIDLLEANFDKQEQFVSNASHELKTPLTVIESYASLLKRRGFEKKDLFDESIDAIQSEAIRMKELTQQLLLLARQGEQWNLTLENINVAELVEESIRGFKNAYDREVTVTVINNIVTIADRQKLKQLLYIFLDNAKKYSDKSISVKVEEKNGAGFIRIEDRGIGIPKEDLPKVFDRFYRVDKARNRKLGGSGLGLSLAKEIADVLNIRIELDSLEGVGTIVTIALPPEDHSQQILH